MVICYCWTTRTQQRGRWLTLAPLPIHLVTQSPHSERAQYSRTTVRLQFIPPTLTNIFFDIALVVRFISASMCGSRQPPHHVEFSQLFVYCTGMSVSCAGKFCQPLHITIANLYLADYVGIIVGFCSKGPGTFSLLLNLYAMLTLFLQGMC